MLTPAPYERTSFSARILVGIASLIVSTFVVFSIIQSQAPPAPPRSWCPVE